MRIGYDAKDFFKKFSKFGSYKQCIIKEMEKHFPDNQYLLYTSDAKHSKDILDVQNYTNIEIRTPAKIISRMNMGNLWRSTILGNTALNDKVDVFHGLSNELPIIISKKLKTVVTIHDLFFIRYPKLYQPLEIEIIKRRIKHACQIANKIIAINNQTAEDIHSFLGISKNKIEVIYPGCDQCFNIEHDLFELKKVIDLYNLPPDFILHLPPFESASGTISLLRALASIEAKIDCPLIIVEHPARSYKKEIMKEAVLLGISERIIFLQQIPSDDLSKIYQLSKLFVYTATYEGSALPIIQALNARVPVITSPGFEKVGGKGAMYVKNKDVEALGETIVKILLNTQLASKMSSGGELHVKQFSNENLANQLFEVYKSVINN